MKINKNYIHISNKEFPWAVSYKDTHLKSLSVLLTILCKASLSYIQIGDALGHSKNVCGNLGSEPCLMEMAGML